jgi:hypothetical protein
MTSLFPGQQANEKIHLTLRQHWAIFALHLFVWMIFAGILVVVDVVITNYAPNLRQPPYGNVVSVIETLYLMFLILGLLIMWILYYLNVHFVTNERVVDIEQKSLLQHTISELHLNRIQDVTAEVHGFWETFLDFGDVYIQTAGETERFVFKRVANPTRVAKIVLDLYEQLSPEEKQKGQS